jgi:hypothetical protein
MQIFGLFCAFAYCLAALIVGVRLISLARRTQQLPELLMGSSFLIGAMIGYPATLVARLLVSEASALAWPLAAAGAIGVAVATFCILLAWWRIYHPASGWAPPVVCAWTALIVACLVLELRQSASVLASLANPWLPLRLIVQGGAFATMAWSGFRYHARLRRRMRIGLADPVVVNRIWLWNLAAAGVTLQCSYILAVPYLKSFFDAEATSPAIYGTLGVIVALCITRAFYPSQAYLRKIRGRAGSEVG